METSLKMWKNQGSLRETAPKLTRTLSNPPSLKMNRIEIDDMFITCDKNRIDKYILVEMGGSIVRDIKTNELYESFVLEECGTKKRVKACRGKIPGSIHIFIGNGETIIGMNVMAFSGPL